MANFYLKIVPGVGVPLETQTNHSYHTCSSPEDSKKMTGEGDGKKNKPRKGSQSSSSQSSSQSSLSPNTLGSQSSQTPQNPTPTNEEDCVCGTCDKKECYVTNLGQTLETNHRSLEQTGLDVTYAWIGFIVHAKTSKILMLMLWEN